VLESPVARAPRRTIEDVSTLTSGPISPRPERDIRQPPITSLVTVDVAPRKTTRHIDPDFPARLPSPTRTVLLPDSARPSEEIVTLPDPFVQPASSLVPEPIEILEDPFLEPATETTPASPGFSAPSASVVDRQVAFLAMSPPPLPLRQPPGLLPQPPAPPSQRQPDPSPKQPGNHVNVDELKARITGANLAIRALEAELHDGRQWNARELAGMIERLRVLVRRADDLRLVWELTPRDQQTDTGCPDSPRAAISRLAANIYQARTRTSAPDFPGTEAQRETELVLLDELSRELAYLATGPRIAIPGLP